MNKQIINFKVDEQYLEKIDGLGCYSSNKVSYIQAHFDLGVNWSGYDSVRAIWQSDYKTIATVLNSLGDCIVPFEVLTSRSKVRVNLVGSISEDDVLTDRITSYPICAFVVDAVAKVDGSNTEPITPSQFEQFAEAVRLDADRAETGAESAEASAESALASAQASEASAIRSANSASDAAQSASDASQAREDAADYAETALNASARAEAEADRAENEADRAEQAAADAGFMEFYINDAGHLIMEHTESVDNIDFELVDGHLVLEVA